MSPITTETFRRLRTVALLIGALVVLGTIGFSLTEHESVWDAFVRTIDTIATTGSIPGASDTGGQIVKVVLTLLGVGTLFYALVTVTELFVSGHLGQLLADRRERRMTASLSDHYIICGYGRVGRQVGRDLRAAGVRYVIIDHDPENREHAGVGVRFIHGPSSDAEVLRDAGIERARAIIACVDSDAENIFVCLTARELRPDIAIVARASLEDSESRLRRAGADRVISPYRSSGHEMARLALHPNVFGSVDVTEEYRLEEIEVSGGSWGAGRTVDEVRGSLSIVGVRRADGTFHPQPAPDTRLEAGDVVMVMGTVDALARLEDGLAASAS
ncbi:MAG: potassium channel family protein [Solirubrobacteraceae bacterium]